MTDSDLRQDLTALAETLRETQARLKEGRAIDMSGLDSRMNDLCARVAHCDPALKNDILADLEIMLSLLNELEASLKRMVGGNETDAARAAALYAATSGDRT